MIGTFTQWVVRRNVSERTYTSDSANSRSRTRTSWGKPFTDFDVRRTTALVTHKRQLLVVIRAVRRELPNIVGLGLILSEQHMI
jgi:hypothetical protein